MLSERITLEQGQRWGGCKHRDILNVPVTHQEREHTSAPMLLIFEKTIRGRGRGGGKEEKKEEEEEKQEEKEEGKDQLEEKQNKS